MHRVDAGVHMACLHASDRSAHMPVEGVVAETCLHALRLSGRYQPVLCIPHIAVAVAGQVAVGVAGDGLAIPAPQAVARAIGRHGDGFGQTGRRQAVANGDAPGGDIVSQV